MKKRVLAAVLVAIMAVTSVGCSSQKGPEQASGPAASEAAGEGKKESAEAVWPVAKNIEIICPANAGSGTDAVCRAIAGYWGEMYPDHNFNVVNDASGGYTVAYEMGRNGEDDGSTILVGTSSMFFTYLTGVYDHLITAPGEFTIINNIAPIQDNICFAVSADSPYQTLEDLVEAAKANPNTISVGTGSGNIVYAQVVSLEKALGVTFRKVDGADNNERISNVLGGFNDWAPVLPSIAAPYVESGDMRVLAIGQNEKSSIYPEFSVLSDFGYNLENFAGQNYIMCATPNMSEEMANFISESLNGLHEYEMMKQACETVINGDWVYKGRQTCIDELEAYADFCQTLGIQ